MSKHLEEDRILEQQHQEAMRNLDRDCNSPVPGFRSRTDSFHTLTSLPGAGKPFSKWPTLQRIQQLKSDLKVCSKIINVLKNIRRL